MCTLWLAGMISLVLLFKSNFKKLKPILLNPDHRWNLRLKSGFHLSSYKSCSTLKKPGDLPCNPKTLGSSSYIPYQNVCCCNCVFLIFDFTMTAALRGLHFSWISTFWRNISFKENCFNFLFCKNCKINAVMHSNIVTASVVFWLLKREIWKSKMADFYDDVWRLTSKRLPLFTFHSSRSMLQGSYSYLKLHRSFSFLLPHLR